MNNNQPPPPPRPGAIASIARRLTIPFRALARRGRVEEELEVELAFHLDREIDDRVRQGMSPDEARRTTLRDFGGVERVKDECRDERGTRPLEDLVRDLRHGARALRRTPGVTLAAICSLALGIGTNTAVFTLVDGLFLRPLPVPHADRLVRLYTQGAKGRDQYGDFSYPDYVDYRARAKTFSGLIAFNNAAFGLT